jgi:hypothetical protein
LAPLACLICHPSLYAGMRQTQVTAFIHVKCYR